MEKNYTVFCDFPFTFSDYKTSPKEGLLLKKTVKREATFMISCLLSVTKEGLLLKKMFKRETTLMICCWLPQMTKPFLKGVYS